MTPPDPPKPPGPGEPSPAPPPELPPILDVGVIAGTDDRYLWVDFGEVWQPCAYRSQVSDRLIVATPEQKLLAVHVSSVRGYYGAGNAYGIATSPAAGNTLPESPFPDELADRGHPSFRRLRPDDVYSQEAFRTLVGDEGIADTFAADQDAINPKLSQVGERARWRLMAQLWSQQP